MYASFKSDIYDINLTAVVQGAAQAISEAELVGRVALATALGAVVGIEREMTDKAAGVRTHALVGLGAAAFTVAGFAVLQVPGAAQLRPELGRIAAQVASGIGFLGAGLGFLVVASAAGRPAGSAGERDGRLALTGYRS